MKHRYATTKDIMALNTMIMELTKTQEKLANKLYELSQWALFNMIKQNPYLYGEKEREEITEQSKSSPILFAAYKDLFLKNPFPSSLFSSVDTKSDGEQK